MSVQPYSPRMPQGGTSPAAPPQAPPAPAAPAPFANPTGGGQEQANAALWQLWLQTSDPTVLEYITSGWTTPVSPAVQQAVSQIVGRQVPTTTAGPGAIGPQTTAPAWAMNPQAQGATPAPGAGAQGGVRDQQPGVGQSAPAVPRPSPAGLGEVLTGTPTAPGGGAVGPGAPGPGYNDTPVPDPNAGRYAANESYMQSFFSRAAPPSPAGAVQQGVQSAQDRVAAAVKNAATPGGGQPVSATPFAPNAQNPLIDPAAGSGVDQMGYGAALNEDPGAQAAVLSKILGDLGVNVVRPGLYTPNFLKTIQPYFQTFLRYYGLTDNQPTADRAQAIAEQFRGMLGGQGTFGQIQNFGRQALGGLPGLLEGIGARPGGVERQIDIVNDLMGILQAGNNAISQEAQQGRQRQQELLFRMGALDPANANMQWPDFIRQQATTGQLPGGDLLAQILGIT